MAGRDPEYWFPANESRVGRGGRPKVRVVRRLADYPPRPDWDGSACRIWQGVVDQDGYGIRTTKHTRGRRARIHRWIWEAVNGPIPAGLVVRHRCDNPYCYRLSHLELGTVADNNRDAQLRGHLGPSRILTPSQVRQILERRSNGETYREIWADYPEVSFATIKRVRASWLDDDPADPITWRNPEVRTPPVPEPSEERGEL